MREWTVHITIHFSIRKEFTIIINEILNFRISDYVYNCTSTKSILLRKFTYKLAIAYYVLNEPNKHHSKIRKVLSIWYQTHWSSIIIF